MNNQKSKRNLCVVIDTNVWVYDTRMLRSPLGAALLYEVHNSQAKIGLPEVIELEITKHAVNEGLKAVEQVMKGYKTIEILVGGRDDFRVPTKSDLEQSVSDRLIEMDAIIYRVPLSLSHAKGALIRVMEETPPNGNKNQQFKDSCIWEAILEISSSFEIHFITTDKAFFEKGDPKKGVASNLTEDINMVGNVIKIHYGIEPFLNEISQQYPAFDEDQLVTLIGNEILKTLPESESQNWLEIGSIIVSSSKTGVFLTEEHSRLAVSFEIEVQVTLFDGNNNLEIGGKARFEGECSFNIENLSVGNIQLESVGTYLLDGTKLRRSVYVRGGIAHSGRRSVPFRIRIPVRSV
jgi:hypothetical protein